MNLPPLSAAQGTAIGVLAITGLLAVSVFKDKAVKEAVSKTLEHLSEVK